MIDREDKIPDEGLAEEFAHVVRFLEDIETQERIKHIPSLLQRAPPLEFHDIQTTTNHENKKDEEEARSERNALISQGSDGTTASLHRFNLRLFSLSMIRPPSTPPSTPSTQLSDNNIQMSFLQQLTTLDLSNNELMEIPGLSALSNLRTLNLERGWFNTLPNEIGSLHHLQVINASRNFLRPNSASLQLQQLKSLSKLQILDLRYNQKCGTVNHYEFITKELPQVQVKVTLWEEIGSIPGSYVGACASERNPRLLRSQLEPWGTVELRRRLVQDFNQPPTDASVVDRAAVMKRLLECYTEEGLVEESSGYEKRKRIHVRGTPNVSKCLIDQLLVELRSWTDETGLDCKNRERPSIDARNYMILRRPNSEDETLLMKDKSSTCSSGSINCVNSDSDSTRASRRAKRKAKKFSRYEKIWNLGMEALRDVDPMFANQCTEIAVTFGFKGSAHRDKQNSGPFYGLSLGTFADGEGGVCVECSARVVAVVNTKDRLGRIDGRYPHWVDSYGHEGKGSKENTFIERYSLIYYETGGNYKKPGPAIFEIPYE